MSDILGAMRTKLLATTAVTDLIGTRIYFDDLPQSATLPAIVIEMTNSEVADRTLSATGTLYRAGINVYCYATTRTTSISVGDAVYAALEFATGTWGSVSVKRALVENTQDVTEPPRDGSAAWRFVRALFTVVWHR